MRRVRAADVALVVSTSATMVGLIGATDLAAGCFLVVLLVGYAGFGLYLAAARHGPSARTWPVLVASGVLLVAAMVRPPIESGDVWSYTSYGRMVAHYHESPWTHVPADHPADPYTPRVVRFWAHTPSVYGPAFAPPAAAVMAVAGTHSTVARVGFQLLAALSVAAAMWMLGRETGWNPGALAVIGINPLIVVSVVNGAHNDAWVGALLLGAVVLVRRERWVVAGMVVAVAAMIKVTAMLALLGLVVWAWRRAGRRPALLLAGTASGIAGAMILVAGGPSVVRAMTWNSWRMTGRTAWAPLRGLVPQARLTTMATVAVVVFATFLVVRHRRASGPAVPVGLVVLAYLLVGAYAWPWYAVWGLIPLGLCWWARTTRLLVVLGMVLELAAVPTFPGLSHQSPTWQVPLTMARRLADRVPYLFAALAALTLVWAVVRWRVRWPDDVVGSGEVLAPGVTGHPSS